MAADEDEHEDATAIFSRESLHKPTQPNNPCHVLIRLDESEVGKVVRLGTEREFVVGRREDCDLVLKYEGVSRRHARLIYEDDAFLVEDLRSANGTVVGGQRVLRQRLNDGDVLQLGPMVSLRYSVTDSHQEQMLRYLYEAAVRDSLTGAYNREYLTERLRSEIAFATRHGGEMSLLLFDVDHFKRVNDTYGHPAGDAVLVNIVQHIQRDLRTEDILARYGGEEFAVCMRAVDLRAAHHVAERIRKSCDRVVRYQEHEIPVSVSVGCANLKGCTKKTLQELIEVADRRLYAAKASGRNRVVSLG